MLERCSPYDPKKKPPQEVSQVFLTVDADESWQLVRSGNGGPAPFGATHYRTLYTPDGSAEDTETPYPNVAVRVNTDENEGPFAIDVFRQGEGGVGLVPTGAISGMARVILTLGF